MPQPFDPAKRGYYTIYREQEVNHCPGCGRSQWIIGRQTAECAYCSTALPLEAMFQNRNASLERPRLIHGKSEPRFHQLCLNSHSSHSPRRQAA